MRHLTNLLLASTALMAPANDGAPGPGTGTKSVEVGVGNTTGSSIHMAVEGQDDVVENGDETGAQSIELGEKEAGVDTEQGDKPEGEDKQEEGDKPADLPEFKADDPEVVKAYDAKYKTDGNLNLDALSNEWWNNQASGEGKLSDGAYKYLAAQGIPEAMVKSIEAGQQALAETSVNAIYDRAGGKVNLEAAIGWATKGNGYTAEQRAAFNEALDAGGTKAAEAVDLLMSRHEKADRSRVNPGKSGADAAGGDAGEGGGKEVFRSKQEWLDARKEAKGDMHKLAEVSKKFRNSPGAARW